MRAVASVQSTQKGAQWLIRFTFSYALTGLITQASQKMWRAVSQSTMGF
jgi:hypothetical protein